MLLAAAILLGLQLPAFGNDNAPRTLKLIRGFNPHLSRESPLQLPMKLYSLSQNEYQFFRGTADLFYRWCLEHCADWIVTPQPLVLLHGDVHPGNVGTFEVHAGKEIQWRVGLVDFDEAFRGPHPFDLLRALTSLRFAAAENALSISEAEWSEIAEHMCRTYSAAISEDSPEAVLDDCALARDLLRSSARDRSRSRQYYDRFLGPDREEPCFRRRVVRKGRLKDIIDPLEDGQFSQFKDVLWDAVSQQSAFRQAGLDFRMRQDFDAALKDLGRYTKVDSAGSQGVEKYLALLLVAAPHDASPIILQLKQQPVPAAERAGLRAAIRDSREDIDAIPAEGASRAAFVAAAQRHYAEAPPRLLGHVRLETRSYLIKPKAPGYEELSCKDLKHPGKIMEAARLLGFLLGRAHRDAFKSQTGKCTEPVLPDLPARLTERSEAVQKALSMQYRDLMNDKEARGLIRSASELVKAAVVKSKP